MRSGVTVLLAVSNAIGCDRRSLERASSATSPRFAKTLDRTKQEHCQVQTTARRKVAADLLFSAAWMRAISATRCPPKNRAPRSLRLRAKLERQGIAGFIVPHADEH